MLQGLLQRGAGLVAVSEAGVGFAVSTAVSVYIGNPGGILNMVPGYVKPDIFGFLFAPIVIAACMIPGYISSIFTKAPEPSKIEGMTYSSLADQSDIA